MGGRNTRRLVAEEESSGKRNTSRDMKEGAMYFTVCSALSIALQFRSRCFQKILLCSTRSSDPIEPRKH